MQNAKDTFYIALRNQLSVVNPARAVLLRGVERPGIYVEEAEGIIPLIAPDVFVLRWTALRRQVNCPLPLAQMDCEVRYTTGGSSAVGGLDRGRALAAMDAELAAMLAPSSAPKLDYTQATPVPMNTFVYWTEPAFGALETARDRLSRVVTVTVFTYEEQGKQ